MSRFSFTESLVEEAALDWLDGLGWIIKHGPDIAPETPVAERTDYGQVVLEQRLRLGSKVRWDYRGRDSHHGGRLEPAPTGRGLLACDGPERAHVLHAAFQLQPGGHGGHGRSRGAGQGLGVVTTSAGAVVVEDVLVSLFLHRL